MTSAAIISRESALRVLGDRGHRLDSLPPIFDRTGRELGFFRADVEALRRGEYRAPRYTFGRVERIAQR